MLFLNFDNKPCRLVPRLESYACAFEPAASLFVIALSKLFTRFFPLLSEIATWFVIIKKCKLSDLFFIKTLHVIQSLNTCLSNRLCPRLLTSGNTFFVGLAFYENCARGLERYHVFYIWYPIFCPLLNLRTSVLIFC